MATRGIWTYIREKESFVSCQQQSMSGCSIPQSIFSTTSGSEELLEPLEVSVHFHHWPLSMVKQIWQKQWPEPVPLGVSEATQASFQRGSCLSRFYIVLQRHFGKRSQTEKIPVLKLDTMKEMFKSNQTRYGVSHGYIDCKTKRIFAIAWLGKKLGLDTEIVDYFEYVIFKYSFFHRVKELFKSNQTRYVSSPVYIESKTKRIFATACLGKKLVSHTEFCYYFK